MIYECQLGQRWSEARRRAETYLRALHGRFGSAERALLTRALTMAREQVRHGSTAHPLTLVMTSLFNLLPAPASSGAAAFMPPVTRASMLPEPTEFPLHDWLRRILPRRRFAFAGPN